MKSKKSQITVFMIIALLIVVGGIAFFYLTKESKQQEIDEVRFVNEEVPLIFDPLKKYANDCAYSIALDGLELIGKQGGYLSFSNFTLNKKILSFRTNPTESDAVIFAPDSELKIPYWWYLKSPNTCNGDCIFGTNRPDLRHTENSMEKQLERYIDLRFRDCLDEFRPFREQGYSFLEKGKLKSDVVIASDDIVVAVDYPIQLSKGDEITDITQFFIRVPINLDKVYDLATKITNMQIKHHYLEKYALNLLVSFSGVDREKLPPMSDLRFEFGTTTSWRKSEIKNKIISMLASYIPLFQVDGTYNYDRNLFASELKQRLYDSTIIPVNNRSFSRLESFFTYLDFWPVYFDLNCRGENCKPSSANTIISLLGIQTYSFSYDLSFPVLVEVKDPFALNNQGYTFRFFLEGNIRNNRYMGPNTTTLSASSVSDRTLLCDIRSSGNVSLSVKDAVYRKPVEEAQVIFTVTEESCYIGSTDSSGSITENYPVAIGGLLNIQKEGYIGKSLQLNPKIETDESIKGDLLPIFSRNIVVKKKNVVKTSRGWRFVNTPEELNEKETAYMSLTRISDDNEQEFASFLNYEGMKGPYEIEIAPGKYNAELTLILNERIVIPEKKKCISAGFSEKCFTIPKIDFAERSSPGQERFPEGGLKLNLTISANDLKNYDTIVIYVVSIDMAGVPEKDRVVQDTDQMSKVDEYAGTYWLALQPTYEGRIQNK